MDALVADGHGRTTADALARLRVARIPVPRPRPGEVLIRIRATPCNPADLLYLEGRYGIDRPLPATPGFEGAGEVVASGGGMLGRWMLGRRVACGGHECTGTWAEYVVTAANQCVPLRRGLSLDQGATALANPMTALSLVALIRRGRHRAYVQTGAAGQLGRMIRAVAHARGLPGIHIVRRAEQAAALRAGGARRVLVSSEDGFPAALAAACRELGATVALDAVAGSLTGQLVDALPPRSEVIVYGALSGDPSGAIDPMRLAFGDRRIRGFELAGHAKSLGLIGGFRLASAAQKLVSTGLATTAVRDRVPLRDAPARLGDYASAMSEGKLLLVP
jgi:NADPH:quinone reductase